MWCILEIPGPPFVFTNTLQSFVHVLAMARLFLRSLAILASSALFFVKCSLMNTFVPFNSFAFLNIVALVFLFTTLMIMSFFVLFPPGYGMRRCLREVHQSQGTPGEMKQLVFLKIPVLLCSH